MATKISLNGKEYVYSFNLGALMNYERISAEMGNNLTNSEMSAVMHYACLLTDKSFTMSADEFVKSIDRLDTLEMLNSASAAEQARWKALNPGSTSDTSESKKK